MAEIVRDRDEWGESLVWWVEWETNDRNFRERHFKTRKQAERFALEIEKELLLEAVNRLQEAHNDMISVALCPSVKNQNQKRKAAYCDEQA